MSREAKNEFIIWTEGQDEDELNRLFAFDKKDLFDEWLWQRYEDSKRD